MKFKKIKQKGSISLTLVIVTAGMLLVSGVTLVLTGIDFAFATKDYTSSNIAQVRVQTCFEESLYRIKNDNTFVGSVNFSYSDGNCSALVTIDSVNSNYRNITLTSQVGDYIYSESKTIDISQSPIQIIN